MPDADETFTPVDKDHREALADCRQVARKEHQVSLGALRMLRGNVNALNEKLKALLDPSGNKSGRWAQLGTELRQRLSGGSAFGEAGEVERDLRKLNISLRAMTQEVIEDTEQSIQRKGSQLEHYTVTLFGRTITGKSTIREFITGGDGSTIGKGAQRTTQSVREYKWAGLRIVDTPGFGAYDGEEDNRLARTMVEESDLILFLTATVPAVQRPSFQEMNQLYEQGKPILFVLNVMHDLANNDLLLEEFLESPEEEVYAPEKIQGHTERIETLAAEHLEMEPDAVRICPIHAQAAFLSTQSAYDAHADTLLEGSRIHNLLRRLSDDVTRNGEKRRIQTITGGTMRAASRLKERLKQEEAALSARATYLQTKINTLKSRLGREKKEALNTRIPNAVARLFEPLRNEISTFLDDNIQRDDVGDKWKAKIEDLDVAGHVERIQEDLEADLQDVLRTFGEEMAVEAEVMGTNVEAGTPSRRDPIDWKRGLGWTSAGSGALATVAGIAGKFSAANFWNPAGLILGGVAIGTGIVAYFTNDKNKKLREAKREAGEQLRKGMSEMEESLCDELKGQYEHHLFPAYSDHAVGMLRTLRSSLLQIQDLLNEEIQKTESVRSDLASRLPEGSAS